MLTTLLLLPLLAALLVLPQRGPAARMGALLAAGGEVLLATYAHGSGAPPEFRTWIPALGIHYSLQLDGLSFLMVFLTALLTGVALWFTPADLPRGGEFRACMLVLMGALVGVFLAANLGLFYIFWEVMILPAFLLVGRWGQEGARRASFKFLLYTLAGSLAMLLAVVVLAFSGSHPDLGYKALSRLELIPELQGGLFVLFFLGFGVKIPVLGLHGWQADTYEQAPGPAAAVIAGAMSKAGLYGLLRITLPILPAGVERAAPWLGALGLLTLLYGALCALGGSRTRPVLAYASLSHMGMMLLGFACLNASGLHGVVLQMFCHGVVTGGLFLLLAALEQRDLPGELGRLGGLATPMPAFGVYLLLFSMASLGLPGLCSFPAELMILNGAWEVNPGWMLLAALGVVGAAWYMLRFFQRVANGPVLWPSVRDLNGGEILGLLWLGFLVVWIGFRPSDWADLVRPDLMALLGGRL